MKASINFLILVWRKDVRQAVSVGVLVPFSMQIKEKNYKPAILQRVNGYFNFESFLIPEQQSPGNSAGTGGPSLIAFASSLRRGVLPGKLILFMYLQLQMDWLFRFHSQ